MFSTIMKPLVKFRLAAIKKPAIHQMNCRFFIDRLFLLPRRFKLLQKAHIVFGEHAQVLYIENQVGNAFNANTKGKTRIDFRINATVFQHIGIYHAATEDFYPTGVFAKATAFATA